MCLLEFPVRSHLKVKALTLSSVALPCGWGAADGKNIFNSASQQRGRTKPGHAADFIGSIGHDRPKKRVRHSSAFRP